ncbi:MAG: alpha/beta hydrolase [Clostridia bacterium]|nr:alpha/beta hydrolase [Clostridia bacterium]
MRSFMSAFSAFVIGLSGYKKKVASPVRREKYIEKLRAKNEKPYNAPPFFYSTKPKKEIIDGVEVFVFNKGKDRKIIYLHGGAFCEQPLLPHFVFCDSIAKKADYEIILPVYKKSPNYTFEKTFDFLEKFYRELLNTVESQNIVFMGDSSGGGLSLSFCEYLNEIGLPQPKRMILLSPWLDVSMDTPFDKIFDKVDPSLQRDFLRVAGKNWAGDTDVHDYRVSPIYGNLSSLAPITVYYGTYEAIITDARIFKEKCEKAGARLDYREYEKMNHVFPVYPIPEAKKAKKEIVDILKK